MGYVHHPDDPPVPLRDWEARMRYWRRNANSKPVPFLAKPNAGYLIALTYLIMTEVSERQREVYLGDGTLDELMALLDDTLYHLDAWLMRHAERAPQRGAYRRAFAGMRRDFMRHPDIVAAWKYRRKRRRPTTPPSIINELDATLNPPRKEVAMENSADPAV